MGCVLERIFWSSQNLIIGRSWILAIGTSGRDNLMYKLVIGFVVGDTFADPFAELGCAFLTKELGIDLQQVRPLASPVVDKRVAGYQLINELFPFDLSRCLVCKKRTHLI